MVKAILVGTTQKYGQSSSSLLLDPTADGAGLVDALAAASSSPGQPANQGLRPSNTFARAIYPILYGQRLLWKDPGYLGINWNSLGWETLTWDNAAWDSFQWTNAAWDSMTLD